MILQVVTDPDRRGAQIFASDLEDAMVSMGESVETVALGPGRHDQVLPITVLGRSRTGPATLRNLVARARQADVVIGHGSTTLYMGAVAATIARRPFVYRQISDSNYWANSARRRFRVRSALRRANAVVGLWSGAADTLVADFGVPRDRVSVIANAVPSARVAVSESDSARAETWREELDQSAVVAAYVGALTEEKGLSDAIEALPEEVDRLLVAGDGPDRSALMAQADRREPERVRFLSTVDNIAAVYAAADFLVFPSVGGDSMPAAVIEAGLASRPVIATNTGALAEIVQHDVTGLLVAPSDVAGMRSAMVALAGDPVRRQEMGAAAARWCTERYEIEVVARQWVDLLHTVMRQ